MNSFAQGCDTQTGLPQFPVRLGATGTDHRTVELGRTPRDDTERLPKRTPNAASWLSFGPV